MRLVRRTSSSSRLPQSCLPTAAGLLFAVSLAGCSLLSLDNLSDASSPVEGSPNASSAVGTGGDDATGLGGQGGDGGVEAVSNGSSTSSAGGGDGTGGNGSGGAGAACAEDDAYTVLEVDGACYRRSKEAATWVDARDRCDALGGGAHLAVLTTEAELEVHGLLYPVGCVPEDDGKDDGDDPCDQRAFVGARFEGAETDLGEEPWAWVTGEAWTWPNGHFEPWTGATEPNESYLALWIEGTLDGRPNETTLPYICESAIE